MCRVVRYDNDDKRESKRRCCAPSSPSLHNRAYKQVRRRAAAVADTVLSVRPPAPSHIRARTLCGSNARRETRETRKRVHDATCRSHVCSEQLGIDYSWTRTRGRLAIRQRVCARQCTPSPCVISDDAQGRPTLSQSPVLWSAPKGAPLGGSTGRTERGERRGLALLRERPSVARTPSYRAILPRLVCNHAAAREDLGPARASRRESAVCHSASCSPPLLKLPRTTTARGQASRARARARLAQAVSGYVNDPQPGVVRELYPWTAMCVRNVDVHVSCSSHVDAQLAAFFIDPRAK